jgi:predicted cation transporter
MTESAETEYIRDMPTTVIYTVLFVVIGLISSVFSVAVGALPTTLWLFISDGFDPIIYQIYLGLFFGIAIPGVSNMNISTNDSENGKSGIEEFRETIETMQENIRIWMIILALMALYINILFIATLWATSVLPAWAWYISLVAPLADRAMVVSIGYSPAFTSVMIAAKLLDWIHFGNDIDLDLVRQLNPAGLTQPQPSAA